MQRDFENVDRMSVTGFLPKSWMKNEESEGIVSDQKNQLLLLHCLDAGSITTASQMGVYSFCVDRWSINQYGPLKIYGVLPDSHNLHS